MRSGCIVSLVIISSFALGSRPAAAQAKPAFAPVDPCALLTKAEVEALVGRPVLAGAREQAANLVTCSFGDPDVPKIGGRPASQVLTIAAFTGQEGAYSGGPVAQARHAYETARRGAASSEPVAGLGEAAHWDKTFKTLAVLKGRHFLTIEVDGGTVEVAKKAASKALARLPSAPLGRRP
jgi:hypothetical protein